MVLAQIDLADLVARDAALTGDRADEVAGAHVVARTDAHEHAAPLAARCRRARGNRLSRRSTPGARLLEQAKRCRSELDAIELGQQRLECEHLASRGASGQRLPKLGAQPLLA